MDSYSLLHAFRKIVSQVFRLTMVAKGDTNNTADHFDVFLETTVQMLEGNRPPTREPNPNPNPPTLVIHETESVVPCVVVTKTNNESNIVLAEDVEECVSEEETVAETEKEETVLDADADADKEETVLETDADNEETVLETDADDDVDEEEMVQITIGKKRYFMGETSRHVYVYINEEEAGECLGKFELGKILPL